MIKHASVHLGLIMAVAVIESHTFLVSAATPLWLQGTKGSKQREEDEVLNDGGGSHRGHLRSLQKESCNKKGKKGDKGCEPTPAPSHSDIPSQAPTITAQPTQSSAPSLTPVDFPTFLFCKTLNLCPPTHAPTVTASPTIDAPPPDDCPCWSLSDLDNVTPENHDLANSCYVADGFYVLANDGSILPGGFASSDVICATSRDGKFIPKAKGQICIDQIKYRCALLGAGINNQGGVTPAPAPAGIDGPTNLPIAVPTSAILTFVPTTRSPSVPPLSSSSPSAIPSSPTISNAAVCPCWNATDLENVTPENQGSNSCITTPDGAYIIDNDESILPGGFASTLSICGVREAGFVLTVTEDQGRTCILQIIARCAVLGTPVVQQTAAPTTSPSTPAPFIATAAPTNSSPVTGTANPTSLATTMDPTSSPVVAESSEPSSNTADPTLSPAEPTLPTSAPTSSPTVAPSSITEEPTSSPADTVTDDPTSSPVDAVTEDPTSSPVETVTDEPTSSPVETVTEEPTSSPEDTVTTTTTEPTLAPSATGSTLPVLEDMCPCWNITDLDNVTPENQDINSCAIVNGFFVVVNDESIAPGGFAANEDFCFERDSATNLALEENNCIEQILNRCAELGTPIAIQPTVSPTSPEGIAGGVVTDSPTIDPSSAPSMSPLERPPDTCPCWTYSDLENVTTENQNVNSCTVLGPFHNLQNEGDDAYAAGDLLCIARGGVGESDPQDITEEETQICVDQIVFRCHEIGTPIEDVSDTQQ